MSISAHDLLMNADVFRRAYPDGMSPPAPEPSAPSLYLAAVPGRPDALLDPAALAALLASGAKVRVHDVSASGRHVPLQLCRDPAGWLVVLPGEAGMTQPVTLALIEVPERESPGS